METENLGEKIEQLKEDFKELEGFLAEARRTNVKDILLSAQKKIQSEIQKLQNIQETVRSSPNTVTSPKIPQANKRYLVELSEYAWDQSDKFVKIYLTLDTIGKSISETDVEVLFTANSMKLTIKNIDNKDYCLTINNLLLEIIVDKSYLKVKPDMVVIYMKKQKERENWSHLTTTEKRVKDLKDQQLATDDSDTKDDPTAGIMNLMKKMYQSGDPDMKRMIAKAWTESQEKKEKVEL